MPLVEQFLEKIYKLKGFLTQVKIKIINKGLGLPIVIKQVAYAGLFLSERVLEWFKPYLTEIQEYKITTINLEAQYIFIIQEGFYNHII